MQALSAAALSYRQPGHNCNSAVAPRLAFLLGPCAAARCGFQSVNAAELHRLCAACFGLTSGVYPALGLRLFCASLSSCINCTAAVLTVALRLCHQAWCCELVTAKGDSAALLLGVKPETSQGNKHCSNMCRYWCVTAAMAPNRSLYQC